MFHFIMPAGGIETRQVDEVFRAQADLLRQRGYGVTLVSDEVFREGASLRGIPERAVVIYRGWMVKIDEYRRLEEVVRSSKATLLTDTDSYAFTHHLPNWYDSLKEYTAETVVIRTADELLPTMHRLGWSGYFLKDFVKSLKVAGGSIVRSDLDAVHWLEKMIEYRDELEGGICIRRVESFLPDSECRYFVFDGTAHAPDDRAIPAPVYAAVERIKSRFFTVDVAITVDNHCRIVELGDGQVSDLVGWTAERFVAVFP